MLMAAVAFALQTAGSLNAMLSIGSDPELSTAMEKVADLTQDGKFGEARAALSFLPHKQVNVDWDDSGVPNSSRFDFAKQRDAVIGEWASASPLAMLSLGKTNPGIRVMFAHGSGMKETWSNDPAQPRLTLEIGLKQGPGPVDPASVHNDFSFAVGSFFGVAKLPMAGFVMAGNDDATQPLRPNRIEISIANANLQVCRDVQEAVRKSQAVEFNPPALSGTFPAIDLGTVLQGTPAPFKIGVSNAGKGPLVFAIVPDCGCISTSRPVVVQPGKSLDGIARLDTTEFSGIARGGVLNHTLVLLTNDPAKPATTIPLTIKIAPRYRMLPTRQVLIADKNGDVTFHAYLYFPTDHPMEVSSAESQGLPGTVDCAPWQGNLADPELNEGPLPRKGYEFTLHLKNVPEGSQFGTNIAVATDDVTFPVITYTVFVQRGILALPPQIFMGEIGAAPRRISFLVSRPGRDFKITAVKTDSKHIEATVAPAGGVGEYRVSVLYDGKEVPGDFHGTVIVTTDDPDQKEIDVAVTGTVRDPKGGGQSHP